MIRKPLQHHSIRLLGAAIALIAACGSATVAAATGAAAATKHVSGKLDPAARALLPKSIRRAGVITDASSLGFAPFDFLSANGKRPEGVDQDLIRAIEPILGVKIQVNNVNYGDIIPSMQSGRYEIGWSAIGEDSSNESVVDFANYIGSGGSGGILVNTKDKSQYQPGNEASLCGKKIAVVIGEPISYIMDPVNAICTQDNKPLATSVMLGTDAEVAVALESGQVDVRTSGLNGAYVAAHSNKQLAFVNNVESTPTSYAGVAVLHGEYPGLIKAIAAALRDTIKDGQYKAILKKWSATVAGIKKVTLLIAT